MKKACFYLFFAFLMMGSDICFAFVSARKPQKENVDAIVVKFKEKSSRKNPNIAVQKTSSFGKAFKKGISHKREGGGGWNVYKLDKKISSQEAEMLIEELKKDGDIENADIVRIARPQLAPNDALYSQQWHYHSSASELAAVNLPDAWDITTGSQTVVVAVLDTGILPHLDINSSRVLPGYDMISDSLSARDGDGRDSDATDMGDWEDPYDCDADDPNFYPSSWHGLHVAGTIGANSNNSSGVAGIDWNGKILPVRVLGLCGGTSDDIADAIRWSAGLSVSGASNNSNPARIINMSLGGYGGCPSNMQDAINSAITAGAIVVVSAGNSTDWVSNYFPANCQNVVAVGALNRAANLATYSNFGSGVTISAPGGDNSNPVLSTLNTGVTTAGADTYIGYYGTSMAAPHISGILALMLAYQPALTVSDMRYNLINTVRSFPGGSSCNSIICGAGMADAKKALDNLKIRVDSILPDTGRNDGNISITNLAGAGFVAGAQVKLTRTGYADVTGFSVVVENLNKISCELPIGGISTGTWNIVVTNYDLSSSTLSGAFNVTYPPPTLSYVLPSSGVNNASVSITELAGTGFLTGATVKLRRNGLSDINALSVNVVSASKITCVFPITGAVPGTWDIVITNPDNQSYTLSSSFNISLPPPALSYISPSSGTNTGYISISTVSGSNFSDPVQLRLRRSGYADIYSTSVIFVSSSLARCSFNITGAAIGFWNFVLINPDSQEAVLLNAFEVKNPPPTLSNIFPTQGVNFGFLTIQANGTYFLSGIDVRLKKAGESDILCSSVYLTGNTKLNCTFNLAGKAAGLWDLHAVNTDGQSSVLPGAFTINNEAPYIESISDNAALSNAAFNLQISGHGFLSGASVKLYASGKSDINASVSYVSNEKIICSLPLLGAAAGDYFLRVTNTDSKYSDYSGYFHILPLAQENTKIYGGIINPSQNEKAHITVKTSSSGKYSIKIYDQLGRPVITVFEGEKSAGDHDFIWAGINEAGKKAASGVYFVHIETPEYKQIKRILIVK